MADLEITKLLREQKHNGERTWRCPDELQLIAYVEKRLNDQDRTSVEAHIADCDFCIGQVAFLTRFPDLESEHAPVPLVSTARNLVTRPTKSGVQWGWRWAAAAAAFAGLALLVAGFISQMRRTETVSPSPPLIAQTNGPSPIASPPVLITTPPPVLEALPKTSPERKPNPPEIRGKTLDKSVPSLIAPREGVAVVRENLEFNWQPVADAVFYEVRLMSAAGDVVLAEQTESTHLKPAASVALSPGTKYFAVVTAHLREGKTTKSEVVSFRLVTH